MTRVSKHSQFLLLTASGILTVTCIAFLIVIGTHNDSEDTPSSPGCSLRKRIQPGEAVIQEGCLVQASSATASSSSQRARRGLQHIFRRSLFTADFYRTMRDINFTKGNEVGSGETGSGSFHGVEEERLFFWDSSAPGYWLKMASGINHNTISHEEAHTLHLLCQDEEVSSGEEGSGSGGSGEAPSSQQRVYSHHSQIREGCPLFFELVDPDTERVFDIRNRSGTQLVDMIRDRIYSPSSSYDPLWENPEEWTEENWENTPVPINCSSLIGRTFDSSKTEDRYACTNSLLSDGDRYTDASTVSVVQRGDYSLLVTQGNGGCPTGEVRVFDPMRYSVLYMILIAHLYNRYEVGSSDPSTALDIQLDYPSRRLSSLDGVDDLPCIQETSIVFTTNFDFTLVPYSPPPPQIPAVPASPPSPPPSPPPVFPATLGANINSGGVSRRRKLQTGAVESPAAAFLMLPGISGMDLLNQIRIGADCAINYAAAEKTAENGNIECFVPRKGLIKMLGSVVHSPGIGTTMTLQNYAEQLGVTAEVTVDTSSVTTPFTQWNLCGQGGFQSFVPAPGVNINMQVDEFQLKVDMEYLENPEDDHPEQTLYADEFPSWSKVTITLANGACVMEAYAVENRVRSMFSVNSSIFGAGCSEFSDVGVSGPDTWNVHLGLTLASIEKDSSTYLYETDDSSQGEILKTVTQYKMTVRQNGVTILNGESPTTLDRLQRSTVKFDFPVNRIRGSFTPSEPLAKDDYFSSSIVLGDLNEIQDIVWAEDTDFRSSETSGDDTSVVKVAYALTRAQALGECPEGIVGNLIVSVTGTCYLVVEYLSTQNEETLVVDGDTPYNLKVGSSASWDTAVDTVFLGNLENGDAMLAHNYGDGTSEYKILYWNKLRQEFTYPPLVCKTSQGNYYTVSENRFSRLNNDQKLKYNVSFVPPFDPYNPTTENKISGVDYNEEDLPLQNSVSSCVPLETEYQGYEIDYDPVYLEILPKTLQSPDTTVSQVLTNGKDLWCTASAVE